MSAVVVPSEGAVTRGKGYQANFFHFIIFPIFQLYQNIGYLVNVMFKFDKWHPSNMNAIQKLELDFYKAKYFPNEKNNERRFSSPKYRPISSLPPRPGEVDINLKW